jgi:hypothetical protein
MSGDGREDLQAVGRPGERIDGVFGMGHQAEDVARLVAHPGDVVQRAVGILAGGVAQQDLIAGRQLVKQRRRRVVATGHVLDGDRQPLAGLARVRKRGVRADDVEVDLAKDEAQARVGQQRPRQEAGLAEDLKAVADPQHQPAGGGELGDLLHDRGKARDRPRPQVVAIGEAARDDNCVDALQVVIAVPQDDRLADPLAGQLGVDLIAGPGKTDHPELHAARPGGSAPAEPPMESPSGDFTIS